MMNELFIIIIHKIISLSSVEEQVEFRSVLADSFFSYFVVISLKPFLIFF